MGEWLGGIKQFAATGHEGRASMGRKKWCVSLSFSPASACLSKAESSSLEFFCTSRTRERSLRVSHDSVRRLLTASLLLGGVS